MHNLLFLLCVADQAQLQAMSQINKLRNQGINTFNHLKNTGQGAALNIGKGAVGQVRRTIYLSHSNRFEDYANYFNYSVTQTVS